MKKLLLRCLLLQACHMNAVVEEFKSSVGLLSVILSSHAYLIDCLDSSSVKAPDITAVDQKEMLYTYN